MSNFKLFLAVWWFLTQFSWPFQGRNGGRRLHGHFWLSQNKGRSHAWPGTIRPSGWFQNYKIKKRKWHLKDNLILKEMPNIFLRCEQGLIWIFEFLIWIWKESEYESESRLGLSVSLGDKQICFFFKIINFLIFSVSCVPTQKRLKFTILGLCVNRAQQLESEVKN